MESSPSRGNYNFTMEEVDEINKQPDASLRVFLAAKLYIKCGYYVVPIVKNKKILPEKRYQIAYGQASRNLRVIEKWFDPYEGIFAGWNIGIASGRTDGLFILDIDKHGSKNGYLALESAVKENGPLPLGPVQSTPSGGRHYLYLWQENASNTAGKIGVGIDTRGGTEHSCRGHIVAWPSVVNKKEYHWESGGKVPVTPKWIMDRLGILWNKFPSKISGILGRGNENITWEDEEVIIEVPQISRMLSFINPDDLEYDDWLRVGMSIKSQHPGNEGFILWDEWSTKGKLYKRNECSIRWDGLDPAGSVRVGTLFYMARNGGWVQDEKLGDKAVGKFDTVVAEMNVTCAIVVMGGKIRVLVEKEFEDEMGNSYDLLDRDSFKILMMNKKIIVNSGGKDKFVPVSDIWLSHPDRRTYKNGIGMFPEGNVPAGYYNSWTGFSVDPIEGDCSLFLDHALQVVCSGDQENYEWLIDWMADLVQFPASPKGCAIVMRGGEGIGKGTLVQEIGRMFGRHFKHLIDDHHLTSNFNAHLLDAIVVFADEITWGGNKRTSGKLKGMVTEKNLVGERKGMDSVLYKNMIHMFIASNSEWVVPAGDSSRRWFILDVSDHKRCSVGYFGRIHKQMKGGGRAALLHMLLNRKVTRNLRRAPETVALEVQRELSADHNSVVVWWSRCIMHGRINTTDEKQFDPDSAGSTWPDIVNKQSLYAEYEEWCLHRRDKVLGYLIFFRELRNMGVSITKPNIKGKRVKMFKIPEVHEAERLASDQYPTLFKEDA